MKRQKHYTIISNFNVIIYNRNENQKIRVLQQYRDENNKLIE